jgi:hypothetical protein
MSARMNSNTNNNSYFKSPQIRYEGTQFSPLLSYPRINSTKMIIHNYQNVFDEQQPDAPDIESDYNKSTPPFKRNSDGQVEQVASNPVQKINVTKSENLFTQLNQPSEFKIASSLKREESGLQRFSMNNVTNIYINYTMKKDNIKTKRSKEMKKFNIYEIRILKKKIKDFFSELADYHVELSEELYCKDFAKLNSLKLLINETDESSSLDESDAPKQIKAMELDNLTIQRKLCLDELKTLLETIQETYSITSSIEKDMINKAAVYIEQINKISDKLKKSIRKEPKSKKVKSKGFQCDYCESQFSTGQALGGHMSRTHPNQSQKYNKKKMIRQERETKRDLIYQARKQLFANHKLDYEELTKSKENKSVIKQIRKENMREYKEILDRLKKEI